MSTVVLAYGEWPYTTGTLLARGFRSLGHDVRVLPLQRYRRGRINKIFRYLERDAPYFSWVDARRWLKRERLSPDLFLWVESPRFVEVKITPNFPCPTAAWAIDTGIRQHRLRFLSRQYDQVYVSQNNAVPQFQAAGVTASWLPLAADPEIHAPVNVPIEFDIGFVGNVTAPAHRQRVELLRALRSRFRLLVTQAYGPEMATAYSRCHLGFNIGQMGGFNMRVFEVMAIGRCLVTDTFADALGQVFVEGRHFRGYDSEANLLAAVEELLKDPGRADAIASAGREEVLAKHTYAHRAATILANLSKRGEGPTAHPMPS